MSSIGGPDGSSVGGADAAGAADDFDETAVVAPPPGATVAEPPAPVPVGRGTATPVGRAPAPPAPVAPTAPTTPTAPLDPATERAGYITEIERDSNWARLPAEAQEAIRGSLRENGSRAVLDGYKGLIAHRTMRTLANSDDPGDAATARGLVDVAARNPDGLAALTKNLGNVSVMLSGRSYREQAEPIRSQIRGLLADEPKLATLRIAQRPGPFGISFGTDASLNGLISYPAFQSMSESRRTEMLRSIARSDTPVAATEQLSLQMADRQSEASTKAGIMAKALKGEQLADWEISRLPQAIQDQWGRLLDDGRAARFFNPPMADALRPFAAKEIVKSFLGGSDASEVLAFFTREHGGLENKFYDLMISDLAGTFSASPTSKEQQDVNGILNNLDPHAAANFTTGISMAVQRKLENPGLVRAALNGFSVEPISTRVNVRGIDVGVKWDPKPLQDAIGAKFDKPYGQLLQSMLRHVTQIRTNDDATRWGAAEAEEFVRKVRNLPGGGNADTLTAGVSRPPATPTPP